MEIIKSPNNYSLVLFHASDLDGNCSACIIDMVYKYNREKLKGTPFFVPFMHSYTFNLNYYTSLFPIKEIIILDISIPPRNYDGTFRIPMKELMDSDIPITWIDHHKSSIDESIEYGYDKLPGIRSIEKAACILTWEYYFPKKDVPRIVKHIGDYDIWNRYYPGVDHINSALRAYDIFYRSNKNGNLMKNDSRFLIDCIEEYYPFDKLILEGIAIERYRKKQWKLMRNKIMVGNLNNLTILLLNNAGDGSRPFEGIEYPHDAVVVFSYSQSGNWVFGIYTNKKEIDVSKIAELYGGGGHPGAAGWTLTNIDEFLDKGNFISLNTKKRENFNSVTI